MWSFSSQAAIHVRDEASSKTQARTQCCSVGEKKKQKTSRYFYASALNRRFYSDPNKASSKGS